MPQVEIDKVDGVRERRACEDALFAESIHDSLRRTHAFIRGFNHLFALRVNIVNYEWGMALRADLFHLDLIRGKVWALLGNRICQIVGQPLGWIVGDTESVEPAHMTRGAGGHEHIARRELLWFGIQ